MTGVNRPNDEEYAMSPMSAPSAGGNYFPPTPVAERPQDAYPTGPVGPNRPAIPTPLSDMHRAGRGPYPFPRSSSFPDAYPGFPHSYSRFSSPSTESLGHGLSYARRPMDYGIPRPANAMVPGYPNRPIEDSVSPTNQQEAPIPYNIETHGTLMLVKAKEKARELTNQANKFPVTIRPWQCRPRKGLAEWT